MQATFLNPKEGINAKSHRKEDKFQDSWTAICYIDGEFKTPVELRTYGTQNTNYACLWVNDHAIYCNGSGKAGGWGYHRPSEAAAMAIQAAGIELSEPIGGRGGSLIESAVKAIAEALGYKEIYIHHAHG